jgi:2',3'-cyclic-nucleotide 2'-phosphodiesterase
MNILYLGDVMAEPGLQLIETLLPGIRKEHAVDCVIAQAENVTNGKGLSKADFSRLRAAGVDACTGGNWTLHNPDIYDHLNDPQQPVVRPANYPEGTPGQRYKFVATPKGKLLVISLLGAIVGKDSDKPTDNPLKIIDEILEETKAQDKVATVVNFHGDFSSEKVIIGYYLDGRVSLVVGDHWHVPTADSMVLPKGTAHQSDVGMCGTLQASLGISFDSVIPRWRDGQRTTNQIETNGPRQFNAVLADIDEQTGLARSIKPIRKIIS